MLRKTNDQMSLPLSADHQQTKARLKRAVRQQVILLVGAVLLSAVLIFTVAVAWFTNSVQTSGIRLRTEAWGFDAENIHISDQAEISAAAPGKSRIVPLTIDNSSGTSDIRAAVTIDKQTMATELQQRIFFYVDIAQSVSFGEGETATTEQVARSYVGSQSTENYVYAIARGETLTMTQAYYSDAPLKWEWVYDLEGYYFRGTVAADAGVTAQEYLRPLTYSFEDAVFDRDSDSSTYGQLLSVGEVSVGSYLKAIMDADGYEGTLLLDENDQADDSCVVWVDGRPYYRVQVDENGYGVWAYLCSYEEILQANAYDSALGETQITATLQVSAYAVEQETVEIAGEDDLLAVWGQTTESQVLQLAGDVEVAAPLVAEEGSQTVIDLNGYSLVYGGEESSYAALQVEEGAQLTLLNGSLIGNGNLSANSGNTQNAGILCRGGEATISGVTVSGFDTALLVDDRTATGDSVVKLTGCTLTSEATTVSIYGNGSGSEAKSRLIIQDCTIDSQYAGVSGQGTNTATDQRWGTELVLINSRISGKWTALYLPQQRSETTVVGCTLTGYTGMVVKGGTVDVYTSTITGTGEHAEARAAGGGWTDTGDGIYVEAVYGWSATVVLRGTDNHVISEQSYALELFGQSGKGPGKLIAEGGTWEGALGDSHSNQIGTLTIG